jgi:hypothetical protein
MKKLISILVLSLLFVTLSKKLSFADTLKNLQKIFPGIGLEKQVKMKFTCTRMDIGRDVVSTTYYKYKLYDDKINFDEVIVKSKKYKMNKDFIIKSKKNNNPILAHREGTGEVLELDLENSFMTFIILTDSKPDLKNLVTRDIKEVWSGNCHKD